MRDLGRAFARALPRANHEDARWRKLPLGDAGSVDVAIEIDASGRLVGMQALGERPPPDHLAAILKRTKPLLESGTFALRAGAVTAGTLTVRLRVRVLEIAVPEERAGGADELAFDELAQDRYRARFTQADGRRVEIDVRVLPAAGTHAPG